MAQPDFKTEPSNQIMLNAPFHLSEQQTIITIQNTTNQPTFIDSKTQNVLPGGGVHQKYFLVLVKMTGFMQRLKVEPGTDLYLAPGQTIPLIVKNCLFNHNIQYLNEVREGDRITLEYTEISQNAYLSKIPNPVEFMKTTNNYRKVLLVKYNI